MIRKLIAVLIAAASVPAMAETANPPAPAAQQGAQQTPQAAPQLPPPETMIVLIRSAMLALHHANATGNYTVLRDLGAPGFQGANSAARLSAIFAGLRDQKIDLSPAALAVPQMTQTPGITPQGMLSFEGHFAMSPMQVNFQFLFQPVDGQWKVFGISVSAAQSASTAQNAIRLVEPTVTGGSNKKPAAESKPKAKVDAHK